MMSCGEFAQKLEAAAGKAEAGLLAPTEEVMRAVETQAKAVLGTYAYGWPQLAPYTLENGNPGNTPGLRSGDTRASVEVQCAAFPGGAEGLVYSDEKKALWFEMGTAGGASGGGWGGPQPPRSFLFKSLLKCEPIIWRVFGAFAERLFT
jgi:hypothetical protein